MLNPFASITFDSRIDSVLTMRVVDGAPTYGLVAGRLPVEYFDRNQFENQAILDLVDMINLEVLSHFGHKARWRRSRYSSCGNYLTHDIVCIHEGYPRKLSQSSTSEKTKESSNSNHTCRTSKRMGCCWLYQICELTKPIRSNYGVHLPGYYVSKVSGTHSCQARRILESSDESLHSEVPGRMLKQAFPPIQHYLWYNQINPVQPLQAVAFNIISQNPELLRNYLTYLNEIIRTQGSCLLANDDDQPAKKRQRTNTVTSTSSEDSANSD